MENSDLLPSGQARIEHMEMRNIVKRFPGVLANDHVNFDVRSGEIHALLGENGAGKSTLMRVLYGLYRPDEGEIRINDQPVSIESPIDAIRMGIGMIHQHFMLVESLTVAENVALGLPSSRGPLTDLDRVSKRIDELARIYGLQVDPGAYVWQLAVGQQQRVEILKALYRGAALLILDEPTAVLRMMVGREVGLKLERDQITPGEVRLAIHNLWAESDRKTPALKGINFEIRAGEILGLAGVSGNGQRELAEVITGLRPASRGQVLLDGQDVVGKSPGEVMARGLSYIPEERMRDGMIKEFTVSENIILREHNRRPYSHLSFLDFSAISERSTELIQRFNVKTPSQETLVKNLSGGNIQKILLARELSRQPKVLVASQPTRGLDIGATEYVHQQLLEQRGEGIATLLISEDLDEILTLSDRVAVIYEGQIMGEVASDQANPEQLGLMMAGVHSKDGGQTAS
ncbi:MAG: ABC transporter ATP-binding protein [Anaerolineales bacterium]